MSTLSKSLAVAALFFLAACEEAAVVPVAVLEVQGTAIDGSEDVEPVVPDEAASEDVAVEEPAVDEQPEPSIESVEPEAPKGPLSITYQDLSLVDYDVDAMLDYMLFPEEYDEEDAEYLSFPDELTDLMDREVSIIGYMIPGEMEQGEVGDFMLVRDLLGCCFGGTPMPDEWIDVIMVEGESAEYRPYLPMRVTGTLTLGGEQDEAGFAMGIYQMSGTEVQVED